VNVLGTLIFAFSVGGILLWTLIQRRAVAPVVLSAAARGKD
jgi:hypothetical protein